jgi:hypothetical protein
MEGMTAVNEYLNQLLRWYALAREAEVLERRLYRSIPAAADHNREWRLRRARSHAIDRLERRQWTIWRIRHGQPVVTTAQVYGWMAAHLADYRHGLDGVDSAEIGGAACEALDLWDEGGSIPMWVLRRGEVFSLREKVERQRNMALFVEKKIQYEEDGDVLWMA